MSSWKRYALVLLASLAWFSLFQPWGSFLDPDAFYHAKMADLISRQGPLQTFPWLDLTTLGQRFADQHFLFHVITIPFDRLFGMLPGAQIAAVVLASLFLLAFYILLERWPISHAWFWTALAGITSPLLFRLSLAKASPLALFWFLLGIFAFAKRRPWLGFLVGFGFALSHGGWIIVLIAQGLFLIGDAMFTRLVEGQPWKKILPISALAVPCMTALGIAAGILIHPNAASYLSFLWVQVVKIGLSTPFNHVVLGEEWKPSELGTFFSSQAPMFIVGLLVVYGLLFMRRASLDRMRARQVIGVGFTVAAMLALTIKSQRFIEYFVPVFLVWLALLAEFVDVQKMAHSIRAFTQQANKRERTIGILALVVVTFVLLRGLINTFGVMHGCAKLFHAFTKPMSAISAEAKAGDRVFHSSWDEFPALFVENDRLKYVAGLDPTFLLDANPSLSDAYTQLTLGNVTTTAYEVIHDRFSSSFVFLTKRNHSVLQNTLAADPRFVKIYDDADTQAYRVELSTTSR